MTRFKLLPVAAIAAMVCLTPNIKADEWNKKTVLTINNQLQLPTVVLEPGTYVMKLVDSPSDRHVVQVFDKDEKHLITTVLAVPNYRLEPTGNSAFAFWEVPAGQPAALRAWFYPGDNFGQEFVYPAKISSQIASYTKTAVPTTSAEADNYKTAEVTSVDQNGQNAELDKKTYAHTEPQQSAQSAPAPQPTPAPVAAAPAPEPAPVQDTPQTAAPEQPAAPAAEPTPAPTPVAAPAPSELPSTGSSIPLYGMVGAMSLIGFFALRARKSA